MEQAAILIGVIDAKNDSILNYVLPRDFTVVGEGLQFTTSNNLQNKQKCTHTHTPCLSSKRTVHFLKIKANKGLQSAIAEHRLTSLIILSIKNEGALYIDNQFTIEDSMALEAQRVDFGC
jgi:hypothetical protein